MLNKETFYPLPIPYHPHPLFFAIALGSPQTKYWLVFRKVQMLLQDHTSRFESLLGRYGAELYLDAVAAEERIAGMVEGLLLRLRSSSVINPACNPYCITQSRRENRGPALATLRIRGSTPL